MRSTSSPYLICFHILLPVDDTFDTCSVYCQEEEHFEHQVLTKIWTKKKWKPQLISESSDSKIAAFLHRASSCRAQHKGLNTEIKRVHTAMAFSPDSPGSVSYCVVFGAVPDGSSSRCCILKFKDTNKKSENDYAFWFLLAVNVLASSRHVASMKLAITSACLADNSSSHDASTRYQRSSNKVVDAVVDNRH